MDNFRAYRYKFTQIHPKSTDGLKERKVTFDLLIPLTELVPLYSILEYIFNRLIPLNQWLLQPYVRCLWHDTNDHLIPLT